MRFVQLPGHKEHSPRWKYAGLRMRTAGERLEHIKIVISVGSTFEAENLQEILTSREDVMGDDLIDVRRIVTGRSGNLPIAILEPTTRGPMLQYAAMRETLNRFPNADHFYESGGIAGSRARSIWETSSWLWKDKTEWWWMKDDGVLDKLWKTRPGPWVPRTRSQASSRGQTDRKCVPKTLRDQVERIPDGSRAAWRLNREEPNWGNRSHQRQLRHTSEAEVDTCVLPRPNLFLEILPRKTPVRGKEEEEEDAVQDPSLNFDKLHSYRQFEFRLQIYFPN